MICIGGDLHRRPPMHALYALSQDAPAGRGCAEEMCYRRRTRPQDGGRRVPTRGKKRLTRQGEKDGEDALRRPQSTAEGGASGGAEPWAPSPRWRARNGEPKANRLTMCPCGWHQEHPGGTRGHGPRQGAKSAYNAPRGGGPGTLGHSPSAIGHGPWPMAIGHVEPCS